MLFTANQPANIRSVPIDSEGTDQEHGDDDLDLHSHDHSDDRHEGGEDQRTQGYVTRDEDRDDRNRAGEGAG